MTREAPVDPWDLDPDEIYIVQGDDVVKELLRKLGVAALFADVPPNAVTHAFVAFDNHPTHWIIINLWQNVPPYSPNHVIHKFVDQADPNGLLFEAYPKNDTRREVIALRLVKQGGKATDFSQLPRT